MREMTCFKAYDIRGRLGENLDEDIAEHVGRAFAQLLDARRVVIGRDCRLSSEVLLDATARGLMREGVEVLDLGLCGTEEVYFATSHFGADGGIEITASHNPPEYNGMKMVRAGSAPLSQEDLAALQRLAEASDFGPDAGGGTRLEAEGARAAYVARVVGMVDVAALRPMKIVVNAGNGTAGPTFDAIAEALAAQGAPLEFIRLHHEPDGHFPNGVPNPLLPENRAPTAEAVRAAGADFGVAWDGDFDRCFLFDDQGEFVPGEYVVGLLATVFLAREPGACIVHDPRVVWNTLDAVAEGGGVPVQTRTGHAFLKQAMRDCGAIYGGEISAHHYFRDFVCCDSGMIPWLMVAGLLSDSGQRLSHLVASRRARFPSSGEINFTLADPAAALARVSEALAPEALECDETDGLSLSFPDWRFNLRPSNTEPLVRLNVEARDDASWVDAGVARVRGLLQAD
ncbi:phosphomannomutase [Alkalilacustris brevis]|uniref:phosphomannomutase n=1 Tax=Alkalilacustris brevis TaxID=2026338 RepID=UPI000E0D61A3|nr:phosphomannomutase [Alkalilacustris brevis]